ncbi:protein adenylyltransferase Fic-like [Uloborus diversus]|uniref:protein adenylyltransferase Fic-like n=1 Tax=Uloborus diversus TaxID=327109 RepID=UPI00240A89C5|nr:protein adenylyltransferase Fic-like [Uloborus diversus]
MALKMKNAEKYSKAEKLFDHAISLQSKNPDVLTHYGEFLEENRNDVVKADHFYVKALNIFPDHCRALSNRKRTLPIVRDLDEKELLNIDKKRNRLFNMNHSSPAVKEVKQELYFHHIHHTVALEGNTMTLSETRYVVETKMPVIGKSIMEHNEVLGLELALRYINKSLMSQDSAITVAEIKQMHKRIMGYVDPVGAGLFRLGQVFVGEHVPPPASEVEELMERFVEWLRSESAAMLHPIQLAALAHYKLVNIHPFVDGNGRTARLLMNLILMRSGYPPVIILKQDRSRYYEYLQLANDGDMRPFVRFIASCADCTLNIFLYANEYGSVCLKALESASESGRSIAL